MTYGLKQKFFNELLSLCVSSGASNDELCDLYTTLISNFEYVGESNIAKNLTSLANEQIHDLYCKIWREEYNDPMRLPPNGYIFLQKEFAEILNKHLKYIGKKYAAEKLALNKIKKHIRESMSNYIGTTLDKDKVNIIRQNMKMFLENMKHESEINSYQISDDYNSSYYGHQMKIAIQMNATSQHIILNVNMA